MRRILPLAILLALTAVAHADQIDDFVLTGNSHTVAFSLPAEFTISDLQHFVQVTSEQAVGSLDGVPGYGITATFFSGEEPGEVFQYSASSAAYPSTDQGGTLYGSPVGFSVVSQAGSGSSATTTFAFDPGTYNEYTFTSAVAAPNSSPLTPYTLTITPETTASAVPEPSTLALLATGSLGLFARLRRRHPRT